MKQDLREDAGQFYPGGDGTASTADTSKGKVTSVNGNAGAVELDARDVGAVPSDALAGETIETNTIPKMRSAIGRIAQALGATVAAVALCVRLAAAATVTVGTAPANELDFNANPSIVTNVTIDVSDLATTNALNSTRTELTNALFGRRDFHDLTYYTFCDTWRNYDALFVAVGEKNYYLRYDGSDFVGGDGSMVIQPMGKKLSPFGSTINYLHVMTNGVFCCDIEYDAVPAVGTVDEVEWGIWPLANNDSLALNSSLSEYATTNSLADALATKADATHTHEGFVTTETVNETVTSALNTYTDEKTGVVWRGVMYDGNLYYVAVTNTPAVN